MATFADRGIEERMADKAKLEELRRIMRDVRLPDVLIAVRDRIQENAFDPRVRSILARYIEDALMWSYGHDMIPPVAPLVPR